MSREEAAAKAIFDIRDDAYDMDDWEDLDSTDRELFDCQSHAALAAADAHDAAHGIHHLVIDEETVERAARVMHPAAWQTSWNEFNAEGCKRARKEARTQARAVLAAAVEAGR